MTKKKILVIAAAAFLLAIFCWFQNNHLVISEHEYRSSKVSSQLDGYTIVQISDLHNKMFGEGQQKLISKIEDCRPDLILVTGDIVDRNRTDIDKAIVFIEEAVKLAPVYYVTGNHERDLPQAEFTELTGRIEAAGGVWLNDETVEIPTFSGNETINIVGVDNDSLLGPAMQELNAGVDRNNVTVLLAHQPQYIKYYSMQGPDMVFSGHAHGGQFRLPFIGGVVAPGQGFFPEYTEGSHLMGSTTMYVSRGLGNSIFPLRLFNYPEIVCVKLKEA